MERAKYDSWIEIDLDAIKHNYREARAALPKQVAIMAVLKADAYGFGAVQIAKELEKARANMLAVSTAAEGLELRSAGINLPILVFLPINPNLLAEALAAELIPTITSCAELEHLAATAQGKSVPFHLKINTGMNRLGVKPAEINKTIEMLKQINGPYLQGVYSHFATAMNKNLKHSLVQLKVFNQACEVLKEAGFKDFQAHMAASAAFLRLPQSQLNMVRLGNVLYGQPGAAFGPQLNLKKAWQPKARIIGTSLVQKGQAVGYGRNYKTKKDMQIGVLAVGYTDGYRVVSKARPQTIARIKADCLIDLVRKILKKENYQVTTSAGSLSVVGRLSMQQLTIDISGKNLQVGDVVDFTLRYTNNNAKIPRIYLKEGKVTAIRDCQGLHCSQSLAQMAQ